MIDKIIQVSASGVENTPNTQTDLMVVGLTESGSVVITNDYGENWTYITPKQYREKEIRSDKEKLSIALEALKKIRRHKDIGEQKNSFDYIMHVSDEAIAKIEETE